MSYLVLARKYRPQTFDDVVQQDHVTKTLSNAITTHRVAHAILFSGPRGTGKTTIARILAKSMNCSEGPTPSPCNVCRSCKEITSGSAVDVFEIDGASNNSVDQIRELRDNIKYMPAHSSHKIYIIDEVHMLSLAAFNALLKTLEEPPSHVMFMFATTEQHKIPITILSRCQRHDLKRVGLNGISNHLKWICEKENIHIPEESLNVIAKEADGCMRDALSLLDQVISSSDGTIDHEKILGVMGVIDRKVIFEISQSILIPDITTLLDTFDGLYNRGYDIKKLYAKLIEHFRNLLLVKIGGAIHKLLDLPENEIHQMATQVQNVPEPFLNQILSTLFKEEQTVRYSSQPKLALEMVFIKIFQIKPALSINTLIEKLDDLKTDIIKTGNSSCSESIFNQREVNGGPAAKVTQPIETGMNIPIPPRALPENNNIVHQKTVPEKVVPNDPVTPSPPHTNLENQEQPVSPEKTIKYSQNESLDDSWENLKNIFIQKHPPIGACLKKSALKKISEESMELEVSGSNFDINRIRKDKTMIIIRKIFRNYFGKQIEIIIQSKPDVKVDVKEKNDKENKLRKEAKSHPVVEEAIKVLNPKNININIL